MSFNSEVIHSFGVGNVDASVHGVFLFVRDGVFLSWSGDGLFPSVAVGRSRGFGLLF